MNANQDLERRLSDLYAAEGSLRAPDRVLGSALTTIESTRQRRALLRVPWRLPNMNVYAKIAVAAVAVIALGAIGLAMLRSPSTGPGTQTSPSPSPSSTPASSPSAPPSPSAEVNPSAASGPVTLPSLDPNGEAVALLPGTYALPESFPGSITFDVPAGWNACPENPVEQGVCGPSQDTFDLHYPGVSFSVVENVVADPCGSEELLDPPVGPSVDDLVSAISNLQGFQATTPVPITVDGYEGKQFEITAGDDVNCDYWMWATAGRTNSGGPGERNVLQVIDIDGQRILIAAAYFPDANSADERAAIDGILGSVHIAP
jgi:hypothetical protein